MADPLNPLVEPQDLPNAEGASSPGGLQAPGGADPGGIGTSLLDYQKMVGRDAREDRKIDDLSQDLAGQARAARLEADNKSVQDGMDEAAERRKQLMGIAVGLLVLGVIGGAIMAFAGAGGQPHTGNAGTGDQTNAVPPPIVLGSAGGTAAPPLAALCALNVVPPPGPTGMPVIGPVEFEWAGIPAVAQYALEVSPPAGGGPLWQFSTTATSKKIYMENFPAGGDYQVSLKALSGNGDVLCDVKMKFTKAAADVPAKNPAEQEGSGASACYSKPCP